MLRLSILKIHFSRSSRFHNHSIQHFVTSHKLHSSQSQNSLNSSLDITTDNDEIVQPDIPTVKKYLRKNQKQSFVNIYTYYRKSNEYHRNNKDSNDTNEVNSNLSKFNFNSQYQRKDDINSFESDSKYVKPAESTFQSTYSKDFTRQGFTHNIAEIVKEVFGAKLKNEPQRLFPILRDFK